MTSPAAALLIAPIRFYQRFITPYTPASCRHYPTCSTYAVTALRTRGALIGTALTVWRVLRCNPWSAGGIDYVPPKGHWRNAARDSMPRAGTTAEDSPTTVRGQEVGHHDGNDRERDGAAASSSTVCSAEHRPADTDLDAPRSAARKPMIGRSAA